MKSKGNVRIHLILRKFSAICWDRLFVPPLNDALGAHCAPLRVHGCKWIYKRCAEVVPQGTFSCPNKQFTLSHRTVKITDHCNSEVSSVISGPASCATYPCRTRAASAQGSLASQAPILLLYQIPHLEKRAKSPKWTAFCCAICNLKSRKKRLTLCNIDDIIMTQKR